MTEALAISALKSQIGNIEMIVQFLKAEGRSETPWG